MPLLLSLLAGCARDCVLRPPAAGETTECRVPGWSGRNVLVHVPTSSEGAAVMPLVVAFHGGGGRKEGMNQLTCADGDEGSDHCLSALADREGFVAAYPDGTAKVLGVARSWNAGGGTDEWRCVGGVACETGVDDVAYTDDLLAMLTGALSIDPARVYATGMSNGAAMAHRLACDRPDRFAAIAVFGGANQAEEVPGCAPSRPVAVAQFHGTEDPCWMPDGTVGPCLTDEDAEGEGETGGRFVGVQASTDGWAARLGCTGSHVERTVVDPVDPRFIATTTVYDGCAAPLELTWIEGAGHVWPGGWPYLSDEVIGETPPGLVGSELVWEFLARAGG